ncbi:hypothetical protein [Vibrio neonatus]|uniref:hypothetical protein n=1 Tax=Vibrio neonatus TaxID=278860 RepID=UPI0021C344F8|nr:hypothetical protein [Vibrio neonatus]
MTIYQNKFIDYTDIRECEIRWPKRKIADQERSGREQHFFPLPYDLCTTEYDQITASFGDSWVNFTDFLRSNGWKSETKSTTCDGTDTFDSSRINFLEHICIKHDLKTFSFPPTFSKRVGLAGTLAQLKKNISTDHTVQKRMADLCHKLDIQPIWTQNLTDEKLIYILSLLSKRHFFASRDRCIEYLSAIQNGKLELRDNEGRRVNVYGVRGKIEKNSERFQRLMQNSGFPWHKKLGFQGKILIKTETNAFACDSHLEADVLIALILMNLEPDDKDIPLKDLCPRITGLNSDIDFIYWNDGKPVLLDILMVSVKTLARASLDSKKSYNLDSKLESYISTKRKKMNALFNSDKIRKDASYFTFNNNQLKRQHSEVVHTLNTLGFNIANVLKREFTPLGEEFYSRLSNKKFSVAPMSKSFVCEEICSFMKKNALDTSNGLRAPSSQLVEDNFPGFRSRIREVGGYNIICEMCDLLPHSLEQLNTWSEFIELAHEYRIIDKNKKTQLRSFADKQNTPNYPKIPNNLSDTHRKKFVLQDFIENHNPQSIAPRDTTQALQFIGYELLHPDLFFATKEDMKAAAVDSKSLKHKQFIKAASRTTYPRLFEAQLKSFFGITKKLLPRELIDTLKQSK